MKKFLALMKVSIRALLANLNGGRKKRKKAVSGIGAAVLIAALALYISGVYSTLLLTVLAPIQMEVLVFIFMGLAALISGLMFTTFAVRSAVFGGKDSDLLLSLPVSTSMLMASRVAAIYLENLLFTFFLLVPAGVAAVIITGGVIGGSVGFWLSLLAAALLLPLLETALSVLLGATIAWLSTKVTRKAIGQNLFMGIYLAVVFWFAFSLQGNIDALATSAAEIKAGMQWAMPILWMGDGIMGDGLALAKFAVVCIVPFVAVIAGFGKVYRKAVTAFTAQASRSDYRMTGQRYSGQVPALLKKEASRFFGTPAYFWNSGLGMILMLALGIVALVKRADLQTFLNQTEILSIIPLICCAIIGFCLSTCAISAPSYSLEGKSLWILRTMPIAEKTIVGVKTGFQLLMTFPFVIVCVACLTIALKMGVKEVMGIFLFATIFEIGHACFGSLVGMAFAKLDANDSSVIKNSLLSFLSIFAPMMELVAVGLLGWQVASHWSLTAAIAVGYALMALLSAVCVVLLYVRGAKMLHNME